MICRTINISKSTYYLRRKVPITPSEENIKKLGQAAKEIFEINNQEYGRMRLHKALNESGYRIGITKTGRIMRLYKIVPKTIKKYKVTTNSKHNLEIAPNVISRNFNAEIPNKIWCGDTTYISTEEGWLYAAGIIDLCGKTCVGLAFSDRHNKELAANALKEAKNAYRPKDGLVFHSDRGSIYASNDFKALIKEYKMQQSMSKSGDPYDNAPMESFWATVKKGCINGVRFKTRKEAVKTIFNYVKGFYNTRRYHTSNNLMTPIEYRRITSINTANLDKVNKNATGDCKATGTQG